MGEDRGNVKVRISQARLGRKEQGKEEEIEKEVDKRWRERRKERGTEAWEFILSALLLWEA